MSLANGTGLVLIWPIWTRYLKFLKEGEHQTSHGREKDKIREELDGVNIVSSRARMIEICSESSFQPLLQLYLLLPNLMCHNYSILMAEDISGFLSNVPKMQFWEISTSCLSLSWSVNRYQALKKRGALDFGVNPVGRSLLLIYCICQVTSRLFAFVFFAYSFGDGNFYPTIVLVNCHILVMAIIHWITTDEFHRTDSDLYSPHPMSIVKAFYQCLLNGISNIYIYNNILLHTSEDKEGKRGRQPTNRVTARKQLRVISIVKKWKELVVDLIFGLENLIMIICSFAFIDGIPAIFLISVAGFYIWGLTLKVIYYKKFHIWSGF